MWRDACFERDNSKCQICGEGGKQVHHIIGWTKAEDKRFLVANGKTLCMDCHQKTDNYFKPKELDIRDQRDKRPQATIDLSALKKTLITVGIIVAFLLFFYAGAIFIWLLFSAGSITFIYIIINHLRTEKNISKGSLCWSIFFLIVCVIVLVVMIYMTSSVFSHPQIKFNETDTGHPGGL